MQSKEKRKTNPRRRLLMRLSLVIVAIAIMLLLGLRALKPTGAQIVYIAPDENGYDAIWLADLNDPENPRQLTHHEGISIYNFQVSNENSIVLYGTYNSDTSDLWIINIDIDEHRKLPICETGGCGDFRLHPNGHWLTFEDYSKPSNKIYVYDLTSSEKYLVFDFGIGHLYTYSPNWVGNTGNLVFRLSQKDNSDEFAFYSMTEHRIVDSVTLDLSLGTPHFSHNGIFYEYSANYSASIIRQLRNINNPDFALHLPYPVYDWHPNDEQLLMVDYFGNENNTENSSFTDIYLFDMLTGEYDVLLSVENSFPQPIFNVDGSQILYSAYIPEVNYRQFMLFDMESREEITLPIVGRDPQWVNGGR